MLGWDNVGLYGVDRDGAVHTSSDAGTSWRPHGDVGGTPEAMALHPTEPGVLFVAVDGRGILRSDDGGGTFTLVHSTS